MWTVFGIFFIWGRILHIKTLYRRGLCNEGDDILKLNVYPSHPTVISPYCNITLLYYHSTVLLYQHTCTLILAYCTITLLKKTLEVTYEILKIQLDECLKYIVLQLTNRLTD
jgi:hypothetical protein